MRTLILGLRLIVRERFAESDRLAAAIKPILGGLRYEL